MKRYWKYIRPYLAAFICGPILMIVEVIGEVLLPKFMANIINVGGGAEECSLYCQYGSGDDPDGASHDAGRDRRRLLCG